MIRDHQLNPVFTDTLNWQKFGKHFENEGTSSEEILAMALDAEDTERGLSPFDTTARTNFINQRNNLMKLALIKEKLEMHEKGKGK